MIVKHRRRWIGLAAAGMFSVMAWGSVVAMGVAVIR